VATLTVRNIPDDAKHRFRQVAAAHGRSMEEHLRHLVIEADFDSARSGVSHVAEKAQPFRHQPSGKDVVHELIKAADGAGDHFLDPRKYAEIRFMSAKNAIAELRRLANGVGFDVPRRMSTDLDAPQF
jgi:hypothetical protein